MRGLKEQPRTDLRVRQPITRQFGDLPLLRCPIVARFDGSSAEPFARCHQLSARALGECFHPDGRELTVSSAQLQTGVDPTILATQPLTVEQVRAGEFHPNEPDPSPTQRPRPDGR